MSASRSAPGNKAVAEESSEASRSIPATKRSAWSTAASAARRCAVARAPPPVQGLPGPVQAGGGEDEPVLGLFDVARDGQGRGGRVPLAQFGERRLRGRGARGELPEAGLADSSAAGSVRSRARSRSNPGASASSRRPASVQRATISSSSCRLTRLSSVRVSSSRCHSRKDAVSSERANASAFVHGATASSPNRSAARPSSSVLPRTQSSISTSNRPARRSSSANGTGAGAAAGRRAGSGPSCPPHVRVRRQRSRGDHRDEGQYEIAGARPTPPGRVPHLVGSGPCDGQQQPPHRQQPLSTACATRTAMWDVARRDRLRLRGDVTFGSV
ncbi:hypothetical protein O1M63_33545 [Streptomyces mirabilis]|nr:hypothetical protein [Streptomyces mirabilis]